jgi:uncharacterized protein YjbI with pentapeptide repeats
MDSKHQSPKLQRRSFRGQNLSGVDFSQANLSGADFTDAILDRANLRYADLRGTIFRRSSLIGADLGFSRSGIAADRYLLLRCSLLILAGLLGMLMGFVGSSISSFLINETRVMTPYANVKFIIPWHTFAGLMAISYGLTYGIVLLRSNPVTALIFGSAINGAIVSTIATGIVVNACIQSQQSWLVTGQLSIALQGLAAAPIFEGIFAVALLAIVLGCLEERRWAAIAIVCGIAISLLSAFSADSSGYIFLGNILIATSMVCASFKISHQSCLNDPGHRVIRRVITYLSTYYGTCFIRANLTDASLEFSLLGRANLTDANFTRTNFYGARELDRARVDRTILSDPRVQSLLVTHQGSQQNYAACNLQGAYLLGANLQNAVLTGANLNDGDLRSAQLAAADLSRISAANTNFKDAELTGACIADWAIDRTTNLEGIYCDYIYLQSPDRERSPASGSFGAGDFTRLFQEISNTVDLIFHHGVNWVAFGQTWQQIQVENKGVDLEIRSIENKGQGLVVIQVEVPMELDKGQLHQDFDRAYGLLLQAVEQRHQAELTGRDRELSIYREQQAQMQSILQSLMNPVAAVSKSEQWVSLKLGARDADRNWSVTVEIGDRGAPPRAATVGILGDEATVVKDYHQWQQYYRQYLNGASRIDIPIDQVTNLTHCSVAECDRLAQQLQQSLNQWLEQESFKPIKELMLQELQPAQSIQIILQTADLSIRRLPFQLWSFFEQFPQAEIAIASSTYQLATITPPSTTALKILAVLGNSDGIDLEPDCCILKELSNVQVEFLVEPTRQALNDQLWSEAWDMLFFAGHSASDGDLATGYLKINSVDRLTLPELKYALKQSINRGLKLVILNSCDGLGLAAELLAMQLPQAIVMREPVPDIVAQQFLRNFLRAFTQGMPLYRAVRSAREQLQGLEDQYPCASWLPAICQNPAEL